MTKDGQDEHVKVRAKSPGEFPILAVERSDGELLTIYYETDYDLQRSKPVGEDWLRENALGRHSFIEITPPKEIAAGDLKDYVQREILGES